MLVLQISLHKKLRTSENFYLLALRMLAKSRNSGDNHRELSYALLFNFHHADVENLLDGQGTK